MARLPRAKAEQKAGFLMEYSFKKSTLLWLVLFLIVPVIVSVILGTLGVHVAGTALYGLSAIIFGLLAFRSYRGGTPRIRTERQPVQSQGALSAGPRFLLVVFGAALGFALGYLTRPSFLGSKVPLDLLIANVQPEFAAIKAELVTHMAVATGVGFFGAAVLLQILVSLRKA